MRPHRKAAELSPALYHRRLFSCDKKLVRVDTPMVTDEIVSDDWTVEALGTLSFVVKRNGEDKETTIYSIVTSLSSDC